MILELFIAIDSDDIAVFIDGHLARDKNELLRRDLNGVRTRSTRTRSLAEQFFLTSCIPPVF